MKKEEFDKKAREFKNIFGFNPPFDRTLLLATKKWTLDIIEFDRMLDKYLPEYDGDECTFNGKPNYSLKMAVQEKFGDKAVELINRMLK